MKILSLNFLTCAVKACKSSTASYPLHPKDAELVQDDIEINEQMLLNVLPRLDWAALRTNATEVRRYTCQCLSQRVIFARLYSEP
jgi:multifunctional methyltransferase subunit TRM112